MAVQDPDKIGVRARRLVMVMVTDQAAGLKNIATLQVIDKVDHMGDAPVLMLLTASGPVAIFRS